MHVLFYNLKKIHGTAKSKGAWAALFNDNDNDFKVKTSFP
jgi:hypothetical protein